MPALADVWPTLSVEVGFDAPLLQAMGSVVWTDISSSVEEASWEWGRQHELQRFEPGRCRLVLDDRDRKFDSANTSSPYAGKLTPMRRLRIRATWSAVTYDLFYGFVLTWPRSWQYQRSSTVTMDATDALGILNLWPVYGSPFEQVVRGDGPTAWLLRQAGSSGAANVVGDTSGRGFDGQLQGSPKTGEPGLIANDPTTSVFFEHAADQRVTVAKNDLLTGFPFTIEFLFRTEEDRTAYKVAFAGESADSSQPSSFLEIGVLSSGAGANAGKLVVALQHPGGLTYHVSDSTVDDGLIKHAVVQMDSPTVARIYINGAGTGSSVVALASRFPDIAYWAIGNKPAVGYGDWGFDGWLQDMIVYQGITLTSSQIAIDHYLGAIRGLLFPNQTGDRVAWVLDEAVGWPSADRALDVGKSSLGMALSSGGVQSYLQAIDTTEYGALFADHRNAGKITFHDRHKIQTGTIYTTSQFSFTDSDLTSDVHYEPPAEWGTDHADVRNVAHVTRAGGTAQVAQDATSIASYGQREIPDINVLHQSDAQAKDLADWLVRQYAQPTTRVRKVDVLPELNPASDWPKILGAQMRQRVTFSAAPPAGSAFSQQMHIERISHSVKPGVWKVSFDLSATDTQTYWILGTSVLGTGTRLGY